MSLRRKTGVISCCRGPNRLWTKLISPTFSCNAKRENSQYLPWNSRKTLAKLRSRFSSDSLKSSLSINFKTASNNPSARSSQNLFISSRIAQGRPPVFVRTSKRHQEFSTNFSTEDSRIISENIHSITPFYLLKDFIIIEFVFLFLFKCLDVRL